MPADAATGAAFFAALTDPAGIVPTGVVGPDGQADAKRFAVYRNTVASTLIEALSASFPAVVRLVGEDFFTAAARDFAATEKPSSPLLFRYGAAFPDFLAGLEALSPYPYIPDVARLDWAWLQSYHAADAPVLTPADLAAVPAEALPKQHLALHPAVRVVASRYPVVTIWTANRGDGPVPDRLPDTREDALVTRPDLNVGVRVLPPGAACLLSYLGAGAPLGAAAGAAASADPGFDLSTALSVLLQAGSLAGPLASGQPDG